TFTLNGTLSASGTTIMGTYSSTDGKGCGTAQSGLQWSAVSVPPLTGTVQGFFHSVNNPALQNQVFPVTGTFTQGQNIGASNATITGSLAFQGYPCLSSASVNGQISGSSVILQIIGSNGLSDGQIGNYAGTTSTLLPVTVLSSSAGVVLQGNDGYGISTSSCPGGNSPGDVGDICLGVGNTTTCTQPLLLSPASLTFPVQQVGTAATTQIITLTNNNITTTPITGLTLSLTSINPAPGLSSPFGPSDFTELPDFTEQDNCASSPGKPFALNPQQSCTITIAFAPQQSCPWMPSIALEGEPPSACPYPLLASLVLKSPMSADSDTTFALPLSGTTFSAIVPATPELDFGAEAVGESTESQTLSFTNQGANPVQILPALSAACVNPSKGNLTLIRPLTPGSISGVQVDSAITADAAQQTIQYSCDSDLTSAKPNFQISADGCSGTSLTPQSSCSLQITFVPQPSTSLVSGLDYFLELNTLQCSSSVTSNCEIDSGRFPVELKANSASPLRMTPAAGLAFGTIPAGQTSSPLTVTLFNDPKDPNAGTVNFTGNILQGSAFAETDNCAGSLTPGSSCTFTVTFTPLKSGYVFTSGTITIGLTVGQNPPITQIIYLRATGE
ncbi:MAG: choice-of-anchor D domain-containing protein, partial [Candidatus Sulfotelmatobacter sp.]